MARESVWACPDCGVGMNHHAGKIDYTAGEGAGAEVFGGGVQEADACPSCGATHTRPATEVFER